jgi:uncharacterized MnhB-related membrane protein
MIEQENNKYIKRDLLKSLILSGVSIMVIVVIYLFVNLRG